MGFASLMSSSSALIAGGLALYLTANNTTLGIILAVVGLVPLLPGIFDFCVFAPLFGAPLSGAKVRARQQAMVH